MHLTHGGFFNTKVKGHHHLQGDVQVYNVRIPEKLNLQDLLANGEAWVLMFAFSVRVWALMFDLFPRQLNDMGSLPRNAPGRSGATQGLRGQFQGRVGRF